MSMKPLFLGLCLALAGCADTRKATVACDHTYYSDVTVQQRGAAYILTEEDGTVTQVPVANCTVAYWDK